MKNPSLGILPLLLVACQGFPVPVEPVPQAAEQTYTFCIDAETESTRSCFSEGEASDIRQAVVAVYAKTGDLVHTGAPGDPVVLNRNHPYSYYVLTGDLTEDTVPLRESALREYVHHYPLDSSGGFVRYHDQWRAVPMAGAVTLAAPSGLASDAGVIRLPAERLFARIDLRILPDENLLRNYTVTIRSVKVRNIARCVAPFDARLTDHGLVSPYEADITREADAEGRWTLYLPENLQGDLLPGNTDPARKTADALSAAGYNPDLCTYIEAEVAFESGFGVSGTARYRFYPGRDNTANFDIRRNTPYTLTLTLTAAGLDIEGSWKIDTSDLSDRRELTLTPLSESVALGGMAILRPSYSEEGVDRTVSRLGARPGYMAGYQADVSRYISGGNVAAPTGYTGIDVVCDDCDHVFSGYPKNGAHGLRLAWFRNLFTDDGAGYFLCPECGNDMGDEETAEIYHDDPLPPERQNPVFLLAFPLPDGAEAGSVLSFFAATHDGKKRAQTTVSVFRPGLFSMDTHLVPKYLAQKGRVSVQGLPSGVNQIRFQLLSGAGVIRLTPGTKSCDILATGLGDASVAVLDAATGEELGRFNVTVSAPVLRISNPSLHLHPDGDAEAINCQYTTAEGTPLRRGAELDETLFDRFLQPVYFVTGQFLTCNTASGDVWISNVDGIPTGFSAPVGRAGARAVDCPQAGTPSVPVYCINPFETMSDENTCLARIDDYTLLPHEEAMTVSFPIQGHINAPVFHVEASPLLESSQDCESMQFSLSAGNTHVLTVTCGKEGEHAHGKVAVSVAIENARTHRYLNKCIGYVEVFLHGAIGGKALLHPDRERTGDGWASCSIIAVPDAEDSPFNDLYTRMTGHPFILDHFDESNLYSVGNGIYYQSDDNDWYGLNHQAQRPEDRIYLTRYERILRSEDGICYPSGEVYRIYPGLIDTYYGHFYSVGDLERSGNINFVMGIYPADIPGFIPAGTDKNGHNQYGLASETDSGGLPYRLLSVTRGWIVFDTV